MLTFLLGHVLLGSLLAIVIHHLLAIAHVLLHLHHLLLVVHLLLLLVVHLHLDLACFESVEPN